MPENLDQVAAPAAEHIEITCVRIAAEPFLDLQREPVHAAPHIRGAGRQPNPHARQNRDHPRSTPSTRRKAAAVTSPPTRMVVPSASLISMVVSAGTSSLTPCIDEDGRASGA